MLGTPRGCSSIMRWFCRLLQLRMRMWSLGRRDDLLRPLCRGERGLGSRRGLSPAELRAAATSPPSPACISFSSCESADSAHPCAVFTPPSSPVCFDFSTIYSAPVIRGTNTNTSHRFFITDVGGVAVSLDAPAVLGIQTMYFMVLSVCSGDTFQGSQWTPETGEYSTLSVYTVLLLYLNTYSEG